MTIMTIDDKIRYEKLQIILTEKQQKYQHYYQVRLINMNILQEKKYCLLIKVELHILLYEKLSKNK